LQGAVATTWTRHSPSTTLSEERRLATKTDRENDDSIVFGGDELTEGVHYVEVKLGGGDVGTICVGIARPGLDTADEKDYAVEACMDAWIMYCCSGSLCGNGKEGSDEAGAYAEGDRVGMLIDLDKGSLQFFKNGVKHGPGWGAGSVTGPVVLAMQMNEIGQSGRLLADVARPIEVGSSLKAPER
jgi:hypothetical protein